MIISNAELVELAKERSPKLRFLIKNRHKKDPSGSLERTELRQLAAYCRSVGEDVDASWLLTLEQFAVSGKLQRMRTGVVTWEDHRDEVMSLVAQQQIPFGINDPVIVKSTGKHGKIMDYLLDQKLYVVIVNPFQMVTAEPKDLIRNTDRMPLPEGNAFVES